MKTISTTHDCLTCRLAAAQQALTDAQRLVNAVAERRIRKAGR